MRRLSLLAFLLLAVPACREQPQSAAAQPASTYTPDSTRQRELDTFRAGLTPVTELTKGASSLEELGGELVRALVAQDTLRLRELILDRAEFAWIYYPTSTQARPPYDLDPATYWLTTESQSGKGLGHALERLGGKTVTFGGVRCEGTAAIEGENRIHGPCLVRITDEKGVVGEGRLFGLVIERHGRWKVVSFANNLD